MIGKFGRAVGEGDGARGAGSMKALAKQWGAGRECEDRAHLRSSHTEEGRERGKATHNSPISQLCLSLI